MARAKRTDRTDARRRHRAQQTSEAEVIDVDAGQDDDDGVRTQGSSRGTAPKGAAAGSSGAAPAARPARPSFIGSARAAYRPAQVREDLAALPRLVVHWSVLVSAALAVVGSAVFLAAGSSSAGSTATNTVGYISSMLVSLFVGPPPFGAALLIGFMLPRATWLVGLLFGVLASACFSAIVLAQPLPEGNAPVVAILAQVWVLGPLGTMLFTAGIAWYKRFLDLLNPNRGQRRQAQKPQQGRGNAPRNRLSGSSH